MEISNWSRKMETSAEDKTEKEKKENYSFYQIARRIMLAGIGAVAITHDELEEFIDKLVERGEIAKKDREELIKEIRERHRKHLSDEENYFHKRMNEVFEHFHVPAKKDFDELSEKISALEKKIDELTKTKK
jgi:poly(hydroxyalkanoate) granule-associated protein